MKARDSISHTVIEIKETVANQVQAVKDTLDWREQYKKRPVAWSVGAAGVGFAVGYGLAALVKGDADDEVLDYYSLESRDHAARPIISSGTQRVGAPSSKQKNGRDDGPGLKLTTRRLLGVKMKLKRRRCIYSELLRRRSKLCCGNDIH